MSNQWSDRWAYSMAQQPQTRGGAFGDAVMDLPFINEPTDFIGDTIDFVQDPSAGDFFEIVTPAVGEDLFDGGGLDDFGYIPIVGDAVDGDGYTLGPGDLGPTVGPNAPKPQLPPPVGGGSCPVGFTANPNFNRNQAMIRSADGTTRSNEPPCIPNPNANATPDGVPSAGGVATGSGLDKNCEEKPTEFPAPAGCMPAVGAEGTFFSAQRTGCRQEWKNLERMEDEVKARYEQLCMAREKFNQRKERYGDMCGPYELLYGIEEAKEKAASEKEKAKKECLANKNPSGGKGGCGCVHKAPSGCGCGCSGKETKKTGMEYEYTDPVKSACKRAVDESFKSTKKARLTRSSCMPREAMKKTVAKKKKRAPVRTLRKPKKTKTTQKAVVTKNYKRQCVAG